VTLRILADEEPLTPQAAAGPREREVERVMGIEPTLVAWEATVLPLNYTRLPMWILCSLQAASKPRG
jgi:hypothetical protein